MDEYGEWMSDSKVPASLQKELRTRYQSWTNRIPPWKRAEQPTPPRHSDTLEWLQFIAHVRQETKQHGWWYPAMAPVRFAKWCGGVIVTYKKTSITIGVLGCIAWGLIGASLNKSTNVKAIERFLSLNKIVTPATIYPSLSKQCPYSFINPITWCTYRVGNEYLEWSTPILDKVQELETLRTDIAPPQKCHHFVEYRHAHCTTGTTSYGKRAIRWSTKPFRNTQYRTD